MCAAANLRNAASICSVKNNGRAVERCLEPSQCGSGLNYVCGINGMEYRNRCLMKVAACTEKTENEVAAEGHCHYGISRDHKFSSVF